MSEAVNYALPQRRLCRRYRHYHGGTAYGLCLVPDCACIRVGEQQKPRVSKPDSEVCERTLVRRAAKAFAALEDEERIRYERAARNFDESDLTLNEFAAELGLDPKLIFRTRRSLRLPQSAERNGGGVAGV